MGAPMLPVSVNSHEADRMEKLVSETLSGEGGPLLLSEGKLCCLRTELSQREKAQGK